MYIDDEATSEPADIAHMAWHDDIIVIMKRPQLNPGTIIPYTLAYTCHIAISHPQKKKALKRSILMRA